MQKAYLANFFILGAPKCATTSMDNWLGQHPLIYMAEKEPHYFNTDHRNRNIKTLQAYQALFSAVNKTHLVVGETSVRYLYSQKAVANILDYNPDAKFVVMLRNPIDMVYSWHQQACFTGLENVQSFEKAWALQHRRKARKKSSQKYPEVKMLYYGEICSLGEQLQRLYNQVDDNRVHLIFFDDLIKDCKKTYKDLLQFLAVPDTVDIDFSIQNKAKIRKSLMLFKLGNLLNLPNIKRNLSNIKRILGIQYKFNTGFYANNVKIVQCKKPLTTKMKQELIEYFRDDIDLLGRLSNRNLTHWTQV